MTLTTPSGMLELIERLEKATERNIFLDMDVARTLGFEIAATTSDYHIVKAGASWTLPSYSSDQIQKANAISRLRARLSLEHNVDGKDRG